MLKSDRVAYQCSAQRPASVMVNFSAHGMGNFISAQVDIYTVPGAKYGAIKNKYKLFLSGNIMLVSL